MLEPNFEKADGLGIRQPLLGDLIQTENFSEIKPPLFNENWCDFLGAACMYSKQNIKIITHIPIFK